MEIFPQNYGLLVDEGELGGVEEDGLPLRSPAGLGVEASVVTPLLQSGGEKLREGFLSDLLQADDVCMIAEHLPSNETVSVVLIQARGMTVGVENCSSVLRTSIHVGQDVIGYDAKFLRVRDMAWSEKMALGHRWVQELRDGIF